MKIKSILIAANNYPTSTDPVHAFLEQIAFAFSKRGVKVTVIAPYRIVQHWVRHSELHPRYREIKVPGGELITVIQPRFLTLGNRFKKFNMWMARRVVCKMAAKLTEKPDVCYGHFWHWSWALYPYANKQNVPLFANTSETPIILPNICSVEKMTGFINAVRGVICASSYCKDQSIEMGLTTAERCKVIPNAIDNNLFKIKNKSELRKQYGFSEEVFIVAFIGWFTTQKGSDRLSKAISDLKDSNIKSFFIGNSQGDINAQPSCEGILYKGRLLHEVIPDYLNMADVFVLPTLAEGCCNSIIEAMACGLPIISSNLPFNWDVLDEENSIMVDPQNVNEIARAIEKIKEDKKRRESMSKAALKTAAVLTIDKRAEAILSFFESRL